jgi:hypothetical protein
MRNWDTQIFFLNQQNRLFIYNQINFFSEWFSN